MTICTQAQSVCSALRSKVMRTSDDKTKGRDDCGFDGSILCIMQGFIHLETTFCGCRWAFWIVGVVKAGILYHGEL